MDGYEPEKLVIPEGIEILTPASGEINLYGTPGYGEAIKAETVYDTADFTKPASEVVIGVPGSDGGEGGGADGTGMVIAGILGVAAIAAAVIFFTRKKV